ncbi:zinc-binding dehydrogenase [Variovorax sp. R-27]|uniref:zinc-binding dehydrogenase n=1 Tax=Variovorax sp. R-27 TaxID=3404058 RepID=UPI003CF6025E
MPTRLASCAWPIAGSGVIQELVAITGYPSRVLSIADLSAPQYGAKSSFEPTESTKALAGAAALFTAGSFTLPVEKAFPLDSIAAAHELSAQGRVTGRLIVTMG